VQASLSWVSLKITNGTTQSNRPYINGEFVDLLPPVFEALHKKACMFAYGIRGCPKIAEYPNFRIGPYAYGYAPLGEVAVAIDRSNQKGGRLGTHSG
jgi:hypothetical protein